MRDKSIALFVDEMSVDKGRTDFNTSVCLAAAKGLRMLFWLG
jgi:hypothetical protein